MFYVPSLKIGKELYNYLSDYLHIDFYQRYGGKEEIDIFKNNKLKNVILLNTNFDKLIIDNMNLSTTGYSNLFLFVNQTTFLM